MAEDPVAVRWRRRPSALQWAGEVVPQEDEIEAAGWFDIDALPGIPPRISIAGHLIRDTAEAMRHHVAA